MSRLEWPLIPAGAIAIAALAALGLLLLGLPLVLKDIAGKTVDRGLRAAEWVGGGMMGAFYLLPTAAALAIAVMMLGSHL